MKIFLKHTLLTVLAVMGFVNMQAQESSRKRIDGVVGVVGSYVILDSDIDNGFIQAKATNQDVSTLSRCEVLGALLENKLFSHQAIQDSIVVTNDEVNSRMDEQIDRMVEYAGSIDNVVKHYNKKSYEDLRETFFDIMKENLLASQMQQELIKDVTITPEEIRQFYNNIPKDSLPLVGDEIELAEIVIKPEITKEQRQAVIDQLNQIRQDVLDGASFTSKVFVYSEDRNSLETGGFFTLDKKSQFVKEFKDVAFSLKEGEISKPFETDFGYHIIFLEKISGKNLELRHILITPKPTQAAIDKAKNDLDDLRIRILNKEISFADAARQYSQDKDSRQSGGIMTNGRGETRFELNKMEDRTLYSMVSNLQVGEISATTLVNDRTESYYKIVQLTNKIPEHLADFSNDYMKIRYVALSAKQSETIAKWVSETVDDTYIYIDDEYQNCTFKSNWLKK